MMSDVRQVFMAHMRVSEAFYRVIACYAQKENTTITDKVNELLAKALAAPEKLLFRALSEPTEYIIILADDSRRVYVDRDLLYQLQKFLREHGIQNKTIQRILIQAMVIYAQFLQDDGSIKILDDSCLELRR